MKEKANPLAGLVDSMKSHANRLVPTEPEPARAQVQPEVPVIKRTITPIQTVATIDKPRRVGNKVFCGARYTRGQIAKMDTIILLTHKERGVRLTQSDVLKQALERMPVAPLEPGEVAELMAANGRKQLNSQSVWPANPAMP